MDATSPDCVTAEVTAPEQAQPPALRFTAVAFLVAAVGALFYYKWGGAFRAVHASNASGKLAVSPDVIMNGGVWVTTLHYFARIWPALAYGVVIGALVRSIVSPTWIAARLGKRGAKSHFAGALVGSPLMLCSCCVTPIFTGVYERGARLGAALSMMLASPGLNVAALTLTAILLPARLAVVRIVAAIALVFVLAPWIGRRFEKGVRPGKGPTSAVARENPPATWGELGLRFGKSLVYMLVVTVPIIVAGVVLSSVLLPYAPHLSTTGGLVAVVLVALVATMVALPTFFEIPLALLLLQLGAPVGAAVALLVAGPIVNLPSLFVLARETNARVALALGAGVWIVASLAGLLAGIGA